MKNISIWHEYYASKETNNQKINNLKTDILIIGGGITGLSTAYFLKDTNKKITLIDKSHLASGITSKTTAKISYLEQDIYRKLKTIYGNTVSKLYYDSRKEAILLLTTIIKDNHIDCDLEKVSSILFTNDDNYINKLNQEKKLITSYGEHPKEYHDNFIKHGFIVDNTYVFNPIKYLNSITKIIKSKVSIYENTIATSIKEADNQYIVITDKGKIIANTIIIACHYPFFIVPNFFPLKTYIEREYVCASEVDNHKKITAINIDKKLYSIRYYGNYLIYVGFDHRLTNKIDYSKNYDEVKNNFNKYFHKKPEYMWINQDIVSNDHLPFIGKIKDNFYISSAYGAWGMTNGTLGGKIIADLINNKENKYIKLFNPKRINLPLVFNSFIGVFHYLKSYIEGTFHKSNPHYIKIKGITYGIYIDKEGIEHRVKLICPHMKCPLVFNQKEKTWDCPCHGSRFDLDGNIINVPAVKKIG